MRFNIVLFLFFFSIAVLAQEAGPANSVIRVPSGGGRASAGSIDLSASAAVGSSLLPIANGGSNKALTLDAGGILWADANSFEMMSAGTSGKALISGGTSTPTWFTPTAGSVLFAGTSGILQEDATALVWDDSNNRLGIGTASPAAALSVGALSRSGTTASTGVQTDYGGGTWTDSNVAGAGTVTTFVNNRYSIPTFNTTNASTTLTTAMNVRVNGCANAGANTQITNCNALYFPAQSVTGTVTNSYQIYVNGAMTGPTNNYAMSITGNSGFGGNTNPTTALEVTMASDVVNSSEALSLRSATTALVSGELVGGILYKSADTSLGSPTTVAYESAVAEATHTGSVLDTGIAFGTTSTLTTSEKMRLSAAGNLGIGTTAPGDTLHVVKAAANTLQLPLRLQNLDTTTTGGSATGIGFKVQSGSTGTSQYKGGIAFEATSSDGRGTLHFLNDNASGSSSVTLAESKMAILRTGSVGIGLTAPTSKVHQDAGNATANYHQFTVGTTTGQTASDGLLVGADATGKAIINQQESAALGIYTAGTEVMSITSGGDVGIGDTSPEGDLEVERATGSAVLKLQATNTSSGGSAITLVKSVTGYTQTWDVGLGVLAASDETFTFYDSDALQAILSVYPGNSTNEISIDLSGTDDAMKLNKVTTANLPGTPLEAMLAYDDTLNGLTFYDGSNWNPVVLPTCLTTAGVTTTTNASSVSLINAQCIRIGSRIFWTARLNITPTGAATQFTVSLELGTASAFTSSSNSMGLCNVNQGGYASIIIDTDTTNDVMNIKGQSFNTTAMLVLCSGSYQVL